MNNPILLPQGMRPSEYQNYQDEALVLKLVGNGKGGTRRNDTQRTEQSTVGVNSGYPRLDMGAVGVAPSAAVAVDNLQGLSPAVGSGPASHQTRATVQQALSKLPKKLRMATCNPQPSS